MKLKEEQKNKSVLTTSYVLTNGSPITFVLYDEDGDWQLFGDDEVDDEEDAYLVSVDEILEMEPILKKLLICNRDKLLREKKIVLAGLSLRMKNKVL